jgi:uncharacterized protein (DUF1697 family)
MPRCVALLRGINVGGKNPIRMPALQACFADLGLTAVATYIQSGNVVFTSAGSATGALVARIEEALAATFTCAPSVVLRTRKQMLDVIERAPPGFGGDPARFRYDVLYLRPPLTAAQALRDVPWKPGVDEVSPGAGVIYFARLVEKASQSRLGKVVSLPIYQRMTIRNWNTTTALVRLLG